MIKPLKLFSANACIGYSSSAPPEFKDANELLQHMNRLGIEKALVWHNAARDYDTEWGNKKLCDDIRTTPGAKGRLIPSFTILPTMLYRESAIDEFRKLVSKENVRVLRAFLNCAGSQSFKIPQYDLLIEQIEDLNPTIILDAKENIFSEDLLNLTKKYSKIKFIITRAMWPHLSVVFDLMKKRSNVILETSWLHTMNTIEYVTKEFGPERLVYGFGNKSHNGASAFSLFTADIDEETKEMVAYKNIEKLVGRKNEITEIPLDFSKGKNYIWQRLDRLVKNNVKIIDAHGHLGLNGKWALDVKDYNSQIELTKKWIKRLSIDKMVVSSTQALYVEACEGNEHLEKSLLKHQECFRGYLAYNPYSAPQLVKRLDDFFSRDFFIGFKLLCDYWKISVTDKRFETVWQYSNKHKLPILLHTWSGILDSPGMLKDIVKEYPDAIFILGHSGGAGIGRYEAEELALDNNNVYLEWCGSFCSPVMWEDTIRKVGNQKIVFGTDSALHNPAYELGSLLTLNVKDEDIVPILGENMNKIINQRKNRI